MTDTTSLLSNDDCSDSSWIYVDKASISNSDILLSDSIYSISTRGYFDVLANCGTRSSSGSGTSVEQTSVRDVLEVVDIKGESPSHEQDGWQMVVKKESRSQKLDYPSKKQFLREDDYQKFRENAKQYWKTANDYSEKAKISRASRNWKDAKYFENQEKMYREKAHQANETASEAIFDSRNKKFENSIAIKLHGQDDKEGMQILKRHLVFAVYIRSLRHLQVIIEPSELKLKQSVVDLLKEENIKCEEENTGSLLITFDGKKRELLFTKSEHEDCEGIQECNAVEKVQAWEAMPDLSEPRSEDVMTIGHFGTSYVASSSNNDPQEGHMPFMGGNRSYASVVANHGSHPPTGRETSSEQTNRDTSEAFYAQEKGPRDELQMELDNPKNVVKNELHRQKIDHHSPKKQHVPGEDCQNQNITASQDSAKILMEKTKMSEKKAQQADESTSQDIFDSRNLEINNWMEIDLHGQHVEEGMKMLQHHLILGVYRRSLWQLRVITGYGSSGTGPSVLRKAG
ncbi:hypothetical protein L2E82_38586 [Cichorium intybus]|uniref:Uncharacterized protein n=1 Tax=Cichorium intybus TaxID=13427 RepID=A0ACB9AH44_CICIN|nr:hypothetical protein L2E82_38586 [Cichorium intybus]